MTASPRAARALQSLALVGVVGAATWVVFGKACRAPEDPARGAHEPAPETQAAAPRSSPLAATGTVAVGQQAPPLELPDLDGRPMSLADFRGRAVVLNAWASWCPPCVEEMPSLIALSRRAPPGVVVVTVTVDETAPVARRAAARMGLRGTILHDSGGHALAAWGTVKYPETWLIRADGVVVDCVIGARDWTGAEALAAIERLVRAPGDGG